MSVKTEKIPDDEILAQIMSSLQYRRIKRLVYRAEWSQPEIEHFLYFSAWGRPQEYLLADFGFRNPTAEAFSIACIKSYGGQIYSTIRPDRKIDCTMRFNFGKLAAWKPLSYLYVADIAADELSRKLRSDVEKRLFPVIREMTTLERLVSRLLNNAEPCPWLVTNGAIRAAHIVFAARQIGTSTEKIHGMLHHFHKQIGWCLESAMAPDVYIDRIIDDADKFRLGDLVVGIS